MAFRARKADTFMKELENDRAQKKEAIWSLACFDTTDVFSHPSGADDSY